MVYVVIRRMGPKIVCMHNNFQRMPTHCLYVRHKLDVRNIIISYAYVKVRLAPTYVDV